MGDNKIDIVIPFRNLSNWSNNEIRYCLRGIEKYIKDYQNIFIIGDKLEIFKNINTIIIEKVSEDITKDIKRNIFQYCKLYENEPNRKFCVFNDDYFTINDLKILNYPYLYKNTLENEINTTQSKGYKEIVMNTANVIGLESKNFDIHKPIIFTVRKYIEYYFATYKIKKQLIRSNYCNFHKIQGVYKSDCKINQNISTNNLYDLIKDENIFSIGNGALIHNYGKICSVKEYLKEKFPIKSIFEK